MPYVLFVEVSVLAYSNRKANSNGLVQPASATLWNFFLPMQLIKNVL